MNRPVTLLSQPQLRGRSGFTLIEILIVLTIVSIMAAALGATITNMLTSAREAQTTATLRKIDGLLNERLQGLQRAFEGRDFRRYVKTFHEKLIKGDPARGIPQLYGLSPKAVEAAARKDFTRLFFPQRFIEMVDVRKSTGLGADRIPDRIQFDAVYGPSIAWTGALFQTPVNHDPITESSELLYFALTRMEVFGTPLISVDDFSTREVADTDKDGLPEFIDGWGNPLRFYRWPTRLFKPYGLLGADGVPGSSGNDGGSPPGSDFDDLSEIGWPGTDDLEIPKDVRFLARLYFEGLPRGPALVGVAPIPGSYDQLNVDPDDAFGILLDQAKLLSAYNIPMLNSISEPRYHTLDTFHRPLVVSAGADGFLGLYEPNSQSMELFLVDEDANRNGILDPGEDGNGNGLLDVGKVFNDVNNDGLFDSTTDTFNDINGNGLLELGNLAQPINEDATTGDVNGNGLIDTFANPFAAYDDLTNHNRRAGD
jgi:prepilin-type N-terminal cleavage/methylation domain-containing protein